jgi:hypothetical protein
MKGIPIANRKYGLQTVYCRCSWRPGFIELLSRTPLKGACFPRGHGRYIHLDSGLHDRREEAMTATPSNSLMVGVISYLHPSFRKIQI